MIVAPEIARPAHEPRSVVFHLSPFAKGCEMAAVSDRRRGYSLHSTPGEAMAALFHRLEVDPRQADVTRMANGEPAIHPVGRPHQPWAFVWRGLTPDEATAALTTLKSRAASRGRR